MLVAIWIGVFIDSQTSARTTFEYATSEENFEQVQSKIDNFKQLQESRGFRFDSGRMGLLTSDSHTLFVDEGWFKRYNAYHRSGP